MAAVMAATYPDLYAAVGVHSGIALPRRPRRRVRLYRDADRRDADRNQRGPPDRHPRRQRRTVAPVNAEQAHRLPDWRQGTSPSQDGPTTVRADGVRPYSRTTYYSIHGVAVAESVIVHGGGHAWYGGNPTGSYTDPQGPDASAEMVRFFLARETTSHRG